MKCGLVQKLWDSDIHEARLLACFIDDWRHVTEKQKGHRSSRKNSKPAKWIARDALRELRDPKKIR